MALTQQDWQQRAQSQYLPNRPFIDGEPFSQTGDATFDCLCPIDGSLLVSMTACGELEVNAAVQSARTAFNDGRWSGLAPRERKKRLLNFAAAVADHREELALLETLDVGKPIRDSLAIDLPMAAEALAWYAEAIDKVYGEVAPTPANIVATVTREPLGVVGVVVPWNFPLMLTCWKIGPALAAGNSVVIKPSELSPLGALRLAELAVDAGIPPGVINVVPGLGDQAGRLLGLHPDVDAISFTGSVAIGKRFLAYAAESNMKRVSLECGGKSPNIVMADAPDLDLAARNASAGIFYNQGEVCMAGSRLLVEESIKDEFLEKVCSWAAKMAPAHPLDPGSRAGALISPAHADRVLGYIRRGQEDGAQLALGGSEAQVEKGGRYLQPTIFDAVEPTMALAQDEIFGPVLATMTFKSPEEAIQIANGTIFGLAAAVWTSNINTAYSVAQKLRSGSVWVNCYNGGDITTPFGGYGQSGIGRDKSLHAIDKYTELKTTWIALH